MEDSDGNDEKTEVEGNESLDEDGENHADQVVKGVQTRNGVAYAVVRKTRLLDLLMCHSNHRYLRVSYYRRSRCIQSPYCKAYQVL